MVFFNIYIMKKSAVLALAIAIVIPLIGYFILKELSKGAVYIPKHYFYDSVNVSKNGSNDTVWHKVRDMEFTNQLGKKVSLSDAHGKILVVNFFFTRCPSICPKLTASMKRLQESFVKNPDIVQFISISVDPEHDSVDVLRKYADKHKINHDTWWMVTGNKTEIYDFAIQEMKANIADPGIDTAFIHTEDIFLLDSSRIIRGWYNGLDTTAQARLVRDIPTLMLEKGKNSPSVLRNFIPVLPLIFFGIGLVIVIMIILERSKKKN